MTAPIHVREEAGVRYLQFGSAWIQGAMRIARPWSLELEYTRDMMASLLLREGPHWPRRVLLIGLGAGSLTKFLYRHRPRARLDVIEIDPQVLAVARFSFRVPEPAGRFAVHIAEGAQWLHDTTDRFDLILVDGFDAKARAGALETSAFYEDARARLSREGLVAVNLLGRERGHAATLATLLRTFEGRVLALPRNRSGNVVAFAAAGEPLVITPAELRKRAATLRQETRLNLLPTIARLEQVHGGQRAAIVL